MGLPALAPPPPLLDEARAIYNLIADGHDRLRYHISRGCAWRDAGTKRALVSSYVPRGEWRPARDVLGDGSERDRHLNPYVIRKHLQGSYDVAFEWPSWTSLIVFDVDRHLPGRQPAAEAHPELVKVANEQRDETMVHLWEALDLEGKQPVVLQTPGGGYHVYLPVCRVTDGEAERTWPAAWLRERIEYRLDQHGLELQPGVLELFPSGLRLRAPCGQGMLLLDEDRQPVEGTFEDRPSGLARRVKPMVAAFCAAIEQARKPLDAWLDEPESRWHSRWGPWGVRAPTCGTQVAEITESQHKEDVLALPSGRSPCSHEDSSGGHLLHGAAFLARVQELAHVGLTASGTRHDAVLKLIWYWMRCQRLSESEALERLSDWLQSHDHVSHLLPQAPRRFFTQSLREAAHYARLLARHSVPGGPRNVNLAPRSLQSPDRLILARLPAPLRSDATAILRHLSEHALPSGHVPDPVCLSTRVLEGLCGDHRILDELRGVPARRRRYVVTLEHLEALGVLSLHTDYSVGRHGKLYNCWYRFGSGQLPREDDDGLLVLAERDVEEGRLQAVSDGTQPATVRLEPNHQLAEVLLATPETRPLPTPWWVRMFQRRAFTPAEFLKADARKVIPGPFRHRFPAKAYQPPREPRQGSAPGAVPSSRAGTSSPRVPDPPLLPPEVEALLAALPPGSLRNRARETWTAWLEQENDSS